MEGRLRQAGDFNVWNITEGNGDPGLYFFVRGRMVAHAARDWQSYPSSTNEQVAMLTDWNNGLLHVELHPDSLTRFAGSLHSRVTGITLGGRRFRNAGTLFDNNRRAWFRLLLDPDMPTVSFWAALNGLQVNQFAPQDSPRIRFEPFRSVIEAAEAAAALRCSLPREQGKERCAALPNDHFRENRAKTCQEADIGTGDPDTDAFNLDVDIDTKADGYDTARRLFSDPPSTPTYTPFVPGPEAAQVNRRWARGEVIVQLAPSTTDFVGSPMSRTVALIIDGKRYHKIGLFHWRPRSRWVIVLYDPSAAILGWAAPQGGRFLPFAETETPDLEWWSHLDTIDNLTRTISTRCSLLAQGFGPSRRCPAQPGDHTRPGRSADCEAADTRQKPPPQTFHLPVFEVRESLFAKIANQNLFAQIGSQKIYGQGWKWQRLNEDGELVTNRLQGFWSHPQGYCLTVKGFLKLYISKQDKWRNHMARMVGMTMSSLDTQAFGSRLDPGLPDVEPIPERNEQLPTVLEVRREVTVVEEQAASPVLPTASPTLPEPKGQPGPTLVPPPPPPPPLPEQDDVAEGRAARAAYRHTHPDWNEKVDRATYELHLRDAGPEAGTAAKQFPFGKPKVIDIQGLDGHIIPLVFGDTPRSSTSTFCPPEDELREAMAAMAQGKLKPKTFIKLTKPKNKKPKEGYGPSRPVSPLKAGTPPKDHLDARDCTQADIEVHPGPWRWMNERIDNCLANVRDFSSWAFDPFRERPTPESFGFCHLLLFRDGVRREMSVRLPQGPRVREVKARFTSETLNPTSLVVITRVAAARRFHVSEDNTNGSHLTVASLEGLEDEWTIAGMYPWEEEFPHLTFSCGPPMWFGIDKARFAVSVEAQRRINQLDGTWRGQDVAMIQPWFERKLKGHWESLDAPTIFNLIEEFKSSYGCPSQRMQLVLDTPANVVSLSEDDSSAVGLHVYFFQSVEYTAWSYSMVYVGHAGDEPKEAADHSWQYAVGQFFKGAPSVARNFRSLFSEEDNRTGPSIEEEQTVVTPFPELVRLAKAAGVRWHQGERNEMHNEGGVCTRLRHETQGADVRSISGAGVHGLPASYYETNPDPAPELLELVERAWAFLCTQLQAQSFGRRIFCDCELRVGRRTSGYQSSKF